MPTVEIYYMSLSPPCRAVEMVANMAGVSLNKHLINLVEREHLKEDYLKINPLHKVPFVVDGELKLNESRAIMAYLVDRYMPADNTLYPRDPVERARVDEVLYIDASLLFPSLSTMYRPLLFSPATEFNPEHVKVFRENLSYFDNRIKASGHKFLLGDNLTIADISLATVLSLVEVFDIDISEFKSVSAYLDQLKTSIPKYQEINKETLESFKEIFKGIMASKTTKV